MVDLNIMGNKILIVDDDPEISSLVQYTLESQGHQVKVCDTGREVMDMLRSYKPDLLVLDVMLPAPAEKTSICERYIFERSDVS